MPANPGQQKKHEKHKKKREAAKHPHATRLSQLDLGPQAILRQAALLPPGPSFISSDWEQSDTAQPRLVSVMVTRKAPAGIVIAAMVLVDRTCLGVKNAFVAKPLREADLVSFAEQIGQAHQVGMVPCDLLVAQSVVLHALDYARSLGFAPHRHFPEPLFTPRPAALVDTPLARPTRPVYVAGPDDPMSIILARLDAAVGPGNYDVVAPSPRA
jgi:hypothetical protein